MQYIGVNLAMLDQPHPYSILVEKKYLTHEMTLSQLQEHAGQFPASELRIIAVD